MAPHHHAPFYAFVIGAAAVVGASLSSVITVQVFHSDMTRYWQDYFAYSLWPVVAFLALMSAAVLIYLRIVVSLDVLDGALLLLTIVNIRNAWDLTLTMVQKHGGED